MRFARQRPRSGKTRILFRAESREPEQAVATFRRDPAAWDAVVTDLTMPGLSGVAVVREMRGLRADVPVILATGFMRDEDVAQARALGVGVFVQKPFTLAVLSESMASVLGLKA